MPVSAPWLPDLPQLILDLRADLRQRFKFHLPERREAWLSWLVTSGNQEYLSLQQDGTLQCYLSEPAQIPGMTRLQELVWNQRPDVQRAFALPADLPIYLDWFFRHGVGEHGLLPLLTPQERQRACRVHGPWQVDLLTRAAEDLLAEPPLECHQRPWGVNLIGYVHGRLGIGEDVRMAAHALHAAGVPFAMVNFKPGHDIAQTDMAWAHKVVDEGPYAVNLFCLTAMEHGRFYAERGEQQLQGRYNIGYWPWELSQWPQAWQQLVHLVDEVWVSTQHTLESVAPVCAQVRPVRPVQHMPMAVTVDDIAALQGQALQKARRATRKRWGLPERACLFCFAFDLNSSIHRKNPMATLEAFQQAFASCEWSPQAVGLVVKVHPPSRPNRAWDALKAWAAQDPRIHLVEASLSRPDLLALYQACDAFVSLHRAEGFGRGLAEALQLGLRLVATGYSGNVDFCRLPMFADRYYEVDYRLVKVKPGQYPYAQGQVWANAKVAQAAQRMRQVAQAVQAAEGVLLPVPPGGWPVFAAQEVGQRYRDRLELLRSALHHAGSG